MFNFKKTFHTIGNIPRIAITFLKEVKTELKKVNWPTRQETLKYTLIVFGVSLAVAIFLGGLDFIFVFLINRFVI